MALANFNIDNPFIIQLRTESDKASVLSVKVIKNLIFLMLLMLISLITLFIGLELNFPVIILTIAPAMIAISITINALKLSEQRTINDIVYGEVYKDIYANNEYLNGLVGKAHEMGGRLKSINEIILLDIILYLIIITIRLIYIFGTFIL